MRTRHWRANGGRSEVRSTRDPADVPEAKADLIHAIYEAIVVAGEPIFERGAATGARPGKLVRAGR